MISNVINIIFSFSFYVFILSYCFWYIQLHISYCWQLVDKNGDGQISFEEFKVHILKDPNEVYCILPNFV